MGALDKQGHKFVGGDGQIKVLKGVIVMMKGKWKYGIYTLLGNIMMRTVVVLSSSKQDNDCTKLWYYRLGHINE